MTDAYGSDTGNPGEGNGSAPNGSQGGSESWTSGLSEDNRTMAEAKGWKGPEDALSSYRNLESRLGTTLTVPPKDASPEAWDAFYKQTGRPETADRYEFNMPDGLADNFLYSEELSQEARNWSHRHGLNPRQADGLHAEFVKYQDAQQRAAVEAQEKAQDEAHGVIVDKWGPADGDLYKRNVQLADRAMSKLGIKEAITQAGLISNEGAVVNSDIAFALAQVGQAMFAEDSLHGDGSDTVNPWSKENENLSLQGEILRKDPDKARAMITAAGLKPADFGLT